MSSFLWNSANGKVGGHSKALVHDVWNCILLQLSNHRYRKSPLDSRLSVAPLSKFSGHLLSLTGIT